MFNKLFKNFDFNFGWSLFKTYQLFGKDFGWRFLLLLVFINYLMEIKKTNLTKAYLLSVLDKCAYFLCSEHTHPHYIVYETYVNSNDIPKLLFDILFVHR